MLRACIFSRRRSDAEQRFTLEPAAGPRRTTKAAGFVLSGGVPGLSSGISTGEAHLARRRVVNESFGAPILSRSKSSGVCRFRGPSGLLHYRSLFLIEETRVDALALMIGSARSRT